MSTKASTSPISLSKVQQPRPIALNRSEDLGTLLQFIAGYRNWLLGVQCHWRWKLVLGRGIVGQRQSEAQCGISEHVGGIRTPRGAAAPSEKIVPTAAAIRALPAGGRSGWIHDV